jgi:hypothetical protein
LQLSQLRSCAARGAHLPEGLRCCRLALPERLRLRRRLLHERLLRDRLRLRRDEPLRLRPPGDLLFDLLPRRRLRLLLLRPAGFLGLLLLLRLRLEGDLLRDLRLDLLLRREGDLPAARLLGERLLPGGAFLAPSAGAGASTAAGCCAAGGPWAPAAPVAGSAGPSSWCSCDDTGDAPAM